MIELVTIVEGIRKQKIDKQKLPLWERAGWKLENEVQNVQQNSERKQKPTRRNRKS